MNDMPPRNAGTQWKTLVAWFAWAFGRLGIAIGDDRLESLSIEVATAMSGPLRRFHTLDHVLHFQPADALETLAVIYHDVVYWSVDGGWPAAWAAPLGAVVEAAMPDKRLASTSDIPYYADVLAVFGLKPGDSIGKSGANELASALAAAVSLGRELGREHLIAVAACIEGTIPFRGLPARLALRDRLIGLGIPAAAIEAMMIRSVHQSNQDVSDFYHADPGTFLSGTWNLLPELNPSLRIGSVFTIGSYRAALVGMDKFFAFLNPELLYDSWGSEPGPQRLASMRRQAGVNLGIARGYIEAKLLAAVLLEALALATGPDVPLPVFMGGAGDPASTRLEARLPALPAGGPTDGEDPVYRLLDRGRTKGSSFDLTNSPLAAWIYRQLDQVERTALADRARQMNRGELSPKAYLASWPRAIIHPILRSLADFVPTRTNAIGELESNLFP